MHGDAIFLSSERKSNYTKRLQDGNDDFLLPSLPLGKKERRRRESKSFINMGRRGEKNKKKINEQRGRENTSSTLPADTLGT